MESRKYQLQKQIQEALKANDNDLYFLLKSQWAHRFGVESLDELKNLDLKKDNQNFMNENSQEVSESQESFLVDDQASSLEDDDNQEKEIINENNKVIESVEVDNKESFQIKSYEIVDKVNNENKPINPIKKNKSQPKLKDLIPLPPNPKYSYLKKWLLIIKI